MPALLGALALATLASAPLGAQRLRFATENDLLANSDTPDDLYTFSVALDLERGGLTWSLHEDAFTDRAAGIRFDATFLGAGRTFDLDGPWDVRAEAGLLHIGRGLFGEHAQNAVHRALGGERVELDYLDASLHPRVAASAERSLPLGRRLDLAPRFVAELVPGVDARALAGVTVRWRPSPRLGVEALVGGRWARALLPALEPHLTALAPAASLGVVLFDRLFVSWAYNEFGDEREHLSAGWRMGLSGGGGEGLSR
jgi:hypothetical protein